MRVHLRGVVIGVGILLSVVLIVSLFNAFDAPPGGSKKARSRHALSMEVDGDDDDVDDMEGASPRSRKTAPKAHNSRSSPRSSTRLRPHGGPGARAGGPGARSAGGLGARAGGLGGPGARAGGPGARAGGPGARAGGPGARAVGPGARAGGPGARVGGPGARPGGPGARAGGPRAGGRAGGPPGRGGPRGDAFDDEDEEDFDLEEVEEGGPRPRGRAGGAAAGRMGARAGPAGGRARAQALDDDDEELLYGGAPGRKAPGKTKAPKKGPKANADGAVKKRKKKEPPYPEWWKTAFQRSAVASLEEETVGDQPLFPECPHFDMGSALTKVKRYGFVQPPNFMRNSKNPCWFEFNGKKNILKCVPYFYIAGVPKGGTSDLYHRLAGHPNVRRGGAVSYFWWDRLRYGASKSLKYTKEAKRTSDPVPLKEFAKYVVGSDGKNVTKEILYLGRSESIFGDASPTYLVENTQWDIFEGNEGCSEPRVIPASFMYHMFPQAKIIIILRDPIERLYSRFLASVPFVEEYINHTASLFHTFTVQAVQNYRDCFSKTSIRHCAYNASLYSNAVIRLSEGMYSVFLEDWFRIFPREQILILKHEDYVQDIPGHIQKVFDHLSLDPLDDYAMLKLSELPVVRKGKTPEEEGTIMPETVSLLNDFYTPFNLRLAYILDDDTWLYKTESQITAPRPMNVDAEEEGNNDIGPPKEDKEEEDDDEEEEDEEEGGGEGEEEKKQVAEGAEQPAERASGGRSAGGSSGTVLRTGGDASGGAPGEAGGGASVEKMQVDEDI
ncbi:uncharacterized protein [Littorina saxatilis]|uniref:uncharacterized protein isoform X2 n=1 Tax=Littorina saxatilis TaxID=31220 RepID=UPI0038B6782D